MIRKLFLAILLCSFLFGCSTTKATNTNETAEPAIPASPGGIAYQTEFETGIEPWEARGDDVVVEWVEGAGYGSKNALKVSNRTKTWHGPIIDATNLVHKGGSYYLSFKVKYDEGPDTNNLVLSVQVIDENDTERFINITGENVIKGEWTEITSSYDVPKNMSAIRFYCETKYKSDDAVTEDDKIDFYISDFSIKDAITEVELAPEKDIKALHTYFDFPLGSAINAYQTNPKDPHYELLRHFNAYVCENEMKQDATEPKKGSFNFTNPDKVVDFAKKNKAKMRGHVLVWHSQVPGWFFEGSGEEGLATKDELYSNMKNHIDKVVGHYKGKIDSWDVVNECLAENGELRNSKYYQIVKSDEYIANAFYWAREADPKAKLFLNDYGIEGPGAKQEGFYKLVKKLKEQGVPIDGIGLQCHISMDYPSVSDLKTTIRRFADLGLLVQVTELDMSIYQNSNEKKKQATNDVLTEQAQRYKALFTMFQEEYKLGNLDMVLVWGLADDITWLNNSPRPGRTNYPLLFGKDLKAKPAYWIFVDPDRLPIFTQKFESTFTENSSLKEKDNTWSLVTPKVIADGKGNEYASFKTLWNEDSLFIMADIYDNKKEDSDAFSVFIEPSNERLHEKSAQASSITVSRANAISDDGKTYTIFAELPFGDFVIKPGKKIGFDCRITNGNKEISYNDKNHSQDTSSFDYAQATLKVLPPLVTANKGTIEVDGKIDKIWNSQPSIPMNVKTQGYTLDGSTYKVLWDDEYVYVLFDVKDSVLNDQNLNAYEQDSIEVFIDQNNAKSASYEPDDGQYRVSFKNFVTFNGGEEEFFKSKTRVTLDGYLVEVACRLYSITPKEGDLLGFDVQINEADATGIRTGIRNWCNETNMGYRDTSGFGLLQLLK